MPKCLFTFFNELICDSECLYLTKLFGSAATHADTHQCAVNSSLECCKKDRKFLFSVWGSPRGARAASGEMDKQQSCKVFVGGLSWTTDDAKLRSYMENFGSVIEAVSPRHSHAHPEQQASHLGCPQTPSRRDYHAHSCCLWDVVLPAQFVSYDKYTGEVRGHGAWTSAALPFHRVAATVTRIARRIVQTVTKVYSFASTCTQHPHVLCSGAPCMSAVWPAKRAHTGTLWAASRPGSYFC